MSALIKTGHTNSIPSAVARREQVIGIKPATGDTATPAPDAPSTSPPSASNPPSSETPASDAAPAQTQTPVEPAPSRPALSPSQLIADSVLASAQLSSPKSFANLGSIFGAGAPESPDSHGHKQNPIHVIVAQPPGSWAWSIAKNILIIALYGFLVITILSIVLENSGLMKTGNTPTEFEPQGGKPVKFSDVHGVDEAKEELKDIKIGRAHV